MYSSTKCIIGYGIASQLLGKVVKTNYANWNNTSSSLLACNLRLCSAIRRHHPPQRAVLSQMSQICCLGECKVVLFQILLDGAEPRDAGTTWLSSPVYRCCIDIKNFLLRVHPSLYLLVSWAWWDWPLTWLTNRRLSVLWHFWLGRLTRKIIPEMTYNVSSGMLNPTIPYRMCVFVCVLLSATSLCTGCDAKCRWSTQLRTVCANRRISACWEQTCCEGTTPALGTTFHQKSSQTLRPSSLPGKIFQSSIFVYVFRCS